MNERIIEPVFIFDSALAGREEKPADILESAFQDVHTVLPILLEIYVPSGVRYRFFIACPMLSVFPFASMRDSASPVITKAWILLGIVDRHYREGVLNFQE